MSEEQKRQWAIILWFHQNIDGPIEMGKALVKDGSISPNDLKEIMVIKNSFTEQPKP